MILAITAGLFRQTLSKFQRLGLVFVYWLTIAVIVLNIVHTVNTFNVEISKWTNLKSLWTYLEPSNAVVICAMALYGSLMLWKGDKDVAAVSDLGDESSWGKQSSHSSDSEKRRRVISFEHIKQTFTLAKSICETAAING
jgi:hypothetical protein